MHPLRVFRETQSSYGVIDGPAPWFETGDIEPDQTETASRDSEISRIVKIRQLSEFVSPQTEVVNHLQEIGFVVVVEMKQSV